MSKQTSSNMFTVTDAQARLPDLLLATSRDPVGITEHGTPVAYLVSKRDFDAMLANVDALTDQLWLARAELARNGGFVGSAEVESILSKLEDVDHAEIDDHKPG